MNHLIDTLDIRRLEGSLLERRDQIVKATAWTFNLVLLGLVVVSFAYFLYVQYTSHTQEVQEEKQIPFTPTTWYSATRNVRNEEYGQTADSQTGYGIQGYSTGGGAEAVW